jgi:hypothetical protein
MKNLKLKVRVVIWVFAANYIIGPKLLLKGIPGTEYLWTVYLTYGLLISFFATMMFPGRDCIFCKKPLWLPWGAEHPKCGLRHPILSISGWRSSGQKRFEIESHVARMGEYWTSNKMGSDWLNSLLTTASLVLGATFVIGPDIYIILKLIFH